MHFSHTKHVGFLVLADAVCISGLLCKILSFQKAKLRYTVLQEQMRQSGGEREKAGNGMRNWAVRKNLRYKDNDHLICFTYGLTILNSWPLFAVFDYGV